jgi:putative NADPH-quinone reductase
MKAIAINGSPRKSWNTATLLEQALAGAASQGATTILTHLYALDYKGCVSCFACKRKGCKTFGKCARRDELTPVLEEIAEADALILGSPIYFGEVTGAMRSFMERLLFPFPIYDKEFPSVPLNPIRTAWIYTMNIPESMIKEMSLERVFRFNKFLSEWLLGPCEELMCFDTLQFEDYSLYAADRFDAAAKRQRREKIFPEDCRKAYELGARLARPT